MTGARRAGGSDKEEAASGGGRAAARASGERADGAGALAPGLYLVSTPIGAARDITLRALDVLGAAGTLAAEDTRTLRRLMEIHGIPLAGRPVVAFHDHSGPAVRARLVARIAEGGSVAYASEAGTPLVSDPGFELVRAAIAAGLPVRAVPGASAVLAALAVAGLPADRFLFAGFPPAQAGPRRTWLNDLSEVPATLVMYEAPHRIAALLAAAAETLGPDRPAALCRELTKRFEDVIRAPLADLRDRVALDPPRGEIVLVIGRAGPRKATEAEVRRALEDALARMSLRDASQEVAKGLGLPRAEVYRLALRISGNGTD